MILILILICNMNTVNAIEESSKNYITPEYIIRNTMENDISSGIIEDGENIETYVDEVWIAVSRLLSQKLVRESAEKGLENVFSCPR